jgi:2-keto-4-pentenoate hydratase/2-oxohepta-3-ene-1,7-dioic acid hydratase in catechol pathway
LSISPSPSKIVCVGRNYRAHARELGNEVPGEPLLFLKPPSSLLADDEPIVLPRASARVEFEGEIGIVVGTRLRRAPATRTAAAIEGIVALNDVTARDLQRTDGQWTRAKGFDTFCPVAAVPVPVGDLASLTIITRVNGIERQRGSSADMVFAIPDLLSYISHIMTLEPGDVIATGTPEGVGPLAAGDTVEVEIEGVSTVRNPVIAEESGA